MIDFGQFMLMVFMALCLYALGLFLYDRRDK
jgi:cbb3-type cytochrome oxidase subunit 3